MRVFEFTAYITDQGETWEAYGYWRFDQSITLNIDALIEMQVALKMGLCGHGFLDLSSLETMVCVLEVEGAQRKRVEEAIKYRQEVAGGVLLRWSKVEPYRKEPTNGQG